MTDDIRLEGPDADPAANAADDDLPTNTADLAYGEALRELETILDDLETSSVDIDHLAEQVARAAHLISLCRDRLKTVEVDVAAAVENLSSSSKPAPEPTATEPTGTEPTATEPTATEPAAHGATVVAT